ncbi:MAG: hypothetical protein KAU24_03120, partial [Candidatus Aenigmarchaeota archaeon]|nr:hypothetical protein [Candidatus Aenigmarchaeota archaeon]
SGSNSGYYNCTWDSTGQREGNWSIQLNSTRTYFNANQTFLQDWFELLNLNASWSDQNVTPAKDGWTKRYNYTVKIDDPEGEEINCTLWIDKYNGQGWINKGKDTIPTGNGTCSVIIWDFTGDDIGNNNFKFMIENSEPENTYNTTNTSGPTLEPSNVTVTFESANNTVVNITNDYEQFVVRINDTDNYTDGTSWHPSGVNTAFWINYNSSSMAPANLTTTNGTGYAYVDFNPTCEYSVGKHEWFAGSTDDYYQKLNTSENLTITIKDDLIQTIEDPDGEEYDRGVNITINVSIVDNCNNNITNVTIYFILTNENSGTNYYCNDTMEKDNGTYNCTFNTSAMEAGWFNITMVSNKTYYNDNTTIKYHAFWIETTPILENSRVSPWIGGWGADFNYSVQVTDEDGDTVRVRLWERIVNGSWSPIQGPGGFYYQDVSGINQTVTFQITTFQCGDLGGEFNITRQFKFNCTDDPDYPSQWDTNETDVKNYTEQRDTVRIDLIDGNNESIKRSGGYYLLRLRIFDLDTNIFIDVYNTQGEFWVTKNGTGDWESSGYVFSDDQGYIEYNFTPACSPKYEVGPQLWRGGTSGDTCFFDNTSDDFNLSIWTDPLNVSLTIPDGERYRRGVDNVTIRGQVQDECGGITNASVTLQAKMGIAYTYDCETWSTVIDESEQGGSVGWYNCTFWGPTNTSQWPDQVLYKFNTTMQASKTYYNDSQTTTDVDSFWLSEPPDIYYDASPHIVSPPSGGWGAQHTFTAHVRDLELADTVNVTLWKKVEGDNWTTINQTNVSSGNTSFTAVQFVHRFNCSEIGPNGTNYYKWNTSDKWDDFNETSTNNFQMLKDNIQSIWMLGHNAEVNREGTDYVTLQVRIRDTDYYNQYIGANYSGRIWITVNGTGTGSWDDGYWNSTDSNGYLTIQFNPDCSPLYKAGYQDWRGGIDFNDTCYKQVNSTDRNVSVKGQLKNYLEIPLYGNQTVVGDPLDVRFNVSTDCDELIPNTTASVEFGAPDDWWNESYTPTDEGTGWYNYTWDTSFHMGGYWDIRINSSIDYYYLNTTTWEDWVYLENTPPNITSANVTPSSGGWGTVFEYSVNIYDDQQDNVTCSLYISTNNGTSYSKWNETIIYGGQDWCNLTVSNFNCSHMNSDENDT